MCFAFSLVLNTHPSLRRSWGVDVYEMSTHPSGRSGEPLGPGLEVRERESSACQFRPATSVAKTLGHGLTDLLTVFLSGVGSINFLFPLVEIS